jgi:hypothetical protein
LLPRALRGSQQMGPKRRLQTKQNGIGQVVVQMGQILQSGAGRGGQPRMHCGDGPQRRQRRASPRVRSGHTDVARVGGIAGMRQRAAASRCRSPSTVLKKCRRSSVFLPSSGSTAWSKTLYAFPKLTADTFKGSPIETEYRSSVRRPDGRSERHHPHGHRFPRCQIANAERRLAST